MSVPNSIKLAVQAMALQALAAVQIFPTWAGTVKSQNANGSLEWAPDATGFLSGLSNVPIRAPLPGWQYTVPANTRVGVVFENGDRQRPAAVLFDPTVGMAITLTVNASQSIALQAPSVLLGGTSSAPASHELVLGDVQKDADDTYDGSIESAVDALNTATGTFATAMASACVGPLAPLAAPVAIYLGVVVSTLSAINTAATQHTADRETVLSVVSQTA